MGIKPVLWYLCLYSFTVASVVPSSIMSYAFNMFTLVSGILLFVAVGNAIRSEEIVEIAVARIEKRGKGWKGHKAGLVGLSLACIPVMLIMAASSHWIITSCWFITGAIVLHLFEEARSELQRRATKG